MLHHRPLREISCGVLLPLCIFVGYSCLSAAGTPAYFYPDPAISTNGTVRVVYFHDNTLYVGGNFTKVYDAGGAYARTDLAAWDMSSGRVTGFVAATDRGTVRAITAGGGKLYVGGSFNSINNVRRSKVAALDPVTGGVVAGFGTDTNSVDGAVWALACSNGKLFVGGSFTLMSALVRSGIAALDAHTGMVDERFDPAPGNWFSDSGKTAAGVFTLEIDPLDSGLVFAGGSFQTICGDGATPFLVALKPDGSRGPCPSPVAPAPILALDARENILCAAVGGYSNRVVTYALDIDPFKRLWRSDRVEGDVQAITYAPQGYVFCGFHGGFYDSIDEYHMAMINANSGEFIEPFPPMNSFFGVWALDFADSLLVAGGEFTKMNGLDQRYLAVFRKLPFPSDAGVAPLPPVLQNPRNGQTGLPVNVQFEWNMAARARSFELQLYTETPGSTTPVLHGCTGVSFTMNDLTTATSFRWRMRSVGERGNAGEWSAERSFSTAPGARDIPVAISPQNGAINQPLAIDLRWHRVESARSYSLQMIDSFAPDSALYDIEGLTDTGYYMTGLKNDVDYTWQVRSETAGGSSGWASVRFRTVIEAPAAPMGAVPCDNAVRVPCRPAVQWKPIDASVNYRLQVACDTDFSKVLFDTSGLTDTTVVVPLLEEDTRYFWRVNAANPGGNAWSPVMCFSTTYSSPGAPNLVAPAGDAVAGAGLFHCIWNRSSPHVSTYRLEIAHDSAMSSAALDTTVSDTEFVQLDLDDGASYWWRVSAYNESGWSTASPIRRITTAAVPGNMPVFKLHRFVLAGSKSFVEYDIAQPCDVRMELFDLKGQSVWVNTRHSVAPGSYRDKIPGRMFTSGRYYLSFRAGRYEKKIAATLLH